MRINDLKLGLAVLAVLPLFLLFNSVGNFGLLDDATSIGPLQQKYVNDGRLDLFVDMADRSGPLGRPVSVFGFKLVINNFGPDLSNFKYVSLCVHIASLLVLLRAVHRIMDHFGIKGSARLCGYAPVVFWGINPLWLSTLMYAVQGMAVYASFFSILMLYCFVQLATRWGNLSVVFRIQLGFASLLFYSLAVFAKENTIIIVLVPALFAFERHLSGLRSQRQRLQLIGVCLVVGFVFLCGLYKHFEPEFYHRSFDIQTRLQHQLLLVPAYTLNFITSGAIFPPSLLHDDISHKIFNLNFALLGVGLWFLCVLIIVRNFGAGVLRPGSIVAVSLASYLLLLAPESSVVPLELHFDHRYYLPTAVLSAGIGLSWAKQHGMSPVASSKGRLMFNGFAALGLVLFINANYFMLRYAPNFSSLYVYAAWELENNTGSARAKMLAADVSAALGNLARAYELSFSAHRLARSETMWDHKFRNVYYACRGGAVYQRDVHALTPPSNPVFTDTDSLFALWSMINSGGCPKTLIDDWLKENGSLMEVGTEYALITQREAEPIARGLLDSLVSEYSSIVTH